MQIIVQEGKAVLSLTAPIHVHDEALRTTTVEEMTTDVKIYYRDYEIIKVEARDSMVEVCPVALGGVFWIEKGRRYQLKAGS